MNVTARMKGSGPGWSVIIVLVQLALAAGCQTSAARLGMSSFEVLEPQVAAPAGKGGAAVQQSDVLVNYIPGYLRQNLRKPVYPPQALAAKLGDCHVYLTVMFDAEGRVRSVSPCWRGISDQNAWTDLFIEAARTAVETWRIEPSHNVYYVKDTSGERHYVRTEALEDTLDLKFTFFADGTVK